MFGDGAGSPEEEEAEEEEEDEELAREMAELQRAEAEHRLAEQYTREIDQMISESFGLIAPVPVNLSGSQGGAERAASESAQHSSMGLDSVCRGSRNSEGKQGGGALQPIPETLHESSTYVNQEVSLLSVREDRTAVALEELQEMQEEEEETAPLPYGDEVRR